MIIIKRILYIFRYASTDPGWQAKYLQGQNKFLNAEVVRLSNKWQDDKGQFSGLQK